MWHSRLDRKQTRNSHRSARACWFLRMTLANWGVRQSGTGNRCHDSGIWRRPDTREVTPAHRQMSMPKPACPNMATATPLAVSGAQAAQEQHADLLELDVQPSAASIRLPEGAAPEGLCVGAWAHIPDTHATLDPEPGTWKPRRSHPPRSTWPNQARIALLAVTHRYRRIHCLWLKQFQIAE